MFAMPILPAARHPRRPGLRVSGIYASVMIALSVAGGGRDEPGRETWPIVSHANDPRPDSSPPSLLWARHW
jgi:hypothetical protein